MTKEELEIKRLANGTTYDIIGKNDELGFGIIYNGKAGAKISGNYVMYNGKAMYGCTKEEVIEFFN